MGNVDRDDLRHLWHATISVPADAVFDDLIARWSAPTRHYHNLEHLHECLRELEAIVGETGDLDTRSIVLALWFHDAIYDATRSDNEAASADLAADRLRQLGESPAIIANVRLHILDTAHRAEPVTSDGRLIVDIDLAILGKPADRFDRYDEAIRAEYGHVPWPDYRTGRMKVLLGFLDRPAIYHLPWFRTLYEGKARANLKRAAARLESSSQ